MKPQTYFHIPIPCHENWENMTPEGKGRFCASCGKEVVDFSLMSDAQVLKYFKTTTGNTCGRFANDQLQRPMSLPPEEKKKTLWIATMMPLLLLFGKLNAQKNKPEPIGRPALVIKNTTPPLMGKIAPGIRPEMVVDSNKIIMNTNCLRTIGDTVLISPSNKLTIKGRLTDAETKQSLPYASVTIKYSKVGVVTDSDGNFTLQVNNDNTLPTVAFTYVGYITREINLNDYNDKVSVVKYNNGTVKELDLREQMTMMKAELMGLVGEVVVCSKRNKHIDTLKTTLNKIFKTQSFKIFPNPAQTGSIVKVEIHKAGAYSLQFLDNNAKLIVTKKIDTENDKAIAEFTIPYDVMPGIYYVILIDENKNKPYTSKLIVQ